jgi:predicted transcriptional regulator
MRNARVGNGPLALNERACSLERNCRNVNSDVTRLTELGLSERRNAKLEAVVREVVAAQTNLAVSPLVYIASAEERAYGL